MKIAMIGLRGIPAKSGGIEYAVENLAVELAKLGVDVTVYCRTPYCPKKPKNYKGVKLRYIPTINTKYTEAFVHTTLSTFDAIFRDFDVVHYHAMGNAQFSFIPRIFGKKTVVTLHGLDWQREKWGLIAKTYLKFCERCITIFPNKVISVSQKIKNYYQSKYRKEIEYIPNGIRIEKKVKLNRLKRFGLKKNKYILFLSRIVPEKGLQYLIPAFKQLKTDIKLVIAGDVTHTEEYLAKIKDMAKNDPRIIFTGPLYGIDKVEAYSNARLFVLPSTIEGMPIVLLEAMSYGLRPLVSDIPENMEIVHDKKNAFKNKDITELRNKLSHLITEKNSNKKESADVKIIKEKYSWSTIAKNSLRLYNEK